MSFIHVVYGGNGQIFGVEQNGNLRWYKYDGDGENSPDGSGRWHPNSSNTIGRGWDFRNILSGDDGVLYAVEQNGNLRWYKYDGDGENSPDGSGRWHPNSSNTIGRGWNFRNILGGDDGVLYGVEQNGNLRWYKYEGDGENSPDGSGRWHPNSSNTIGRGWDFRHVISLSGIILAVKENGDLLWYKYEGDGENSPDGSGRWHPNSSNTIGRGWNSFRHIFGGYSRGGFVIYGVEQNGDLRWYKYEGNGENHPDGSGRWHPNSGNIIGRGW